MGISLDQAYCTKLLVDMVRIDSVNPDLVPGAAGEAELARYIYTAMQEIGLDAELIEVAPNRPNVIGRLKGSGAGRSLMLNAHTDTVGVDGMEAPFSAEIRDGCLYGRGSYDMKASIAAMLTVAKSLIDSKIQLAGDLVLAMVIDEEYGSLGTEHVVQHYPTDAAIVTEPTELRVCVAHRGWYWVDVETIGKAAHGSRPQEGIDANRLMAHFLVAIDQYAEDLINRPPHPLLGPPSIHVPLLSGGSSSAVYAARSKAQLERRVLPGETVEQVKQEIQEIADHLTQEIPNFRAIVSAGFGRPAYEVQQVTKIVQQVIQSTEKTLGTQPELYGELWWMDSSLLGDAGIETVIIGPKGGGIHSDLEWVDLESVYQLGTILLDVVIEYCGKDGQ